MESEIERREVRPVRTLKRSECAVLHLGLKSHWFRMIDSGVKNAEFLAVNTDKGAYVIKFADIDTPREISFKAKLEKIL